MVTRKSLTRLQRLRYRARQRGMAVSLAMAARAWHLALKPGAPSLPRAALRRCREAHEALLAEDLRHAERGQYPPELLFQMPVKDYLARLPAGLPECGRILKRSRKNRHDDLPREVDLSAYPSYYTRTFHWQSDGWLSARSARLYDPGVEFLLLGTADVMRRQAIVPAVRAVGGLRQPRILDVACGTGRFLSQLAAVLPNARLAGLDLSSYYLDEARHLLDDVSDVTLVGANAESMPLESQSFDAVTSVYLFHELPKDARRNVMRELRRVVADDGVVVIMDSLQLADRTGLEPFLESFPRLYHEPYFEGYLHDPLEDALVEAGFEIEQSSVHFLSKRVVARPARLVA